MLKTTLSRQKTSVLVFVVATLVPSCGLRKVSQDPHPQSADSTAGAKLDTTGLTGMDEVMSGHHGAKAHVMALAVKALASLYPRGFFASALDARWQYLTCGLAGKIPAKTSKFYLSFIATKAKSPEDMATWLAASLRSLEAQQNKVTAMKFCAMIHKNQADIAALQTQNDDLANRVSALESGNADLTNRITSLNAQLADAVKTVNKSLDALSQGQASDHNALLAAVGDIKAANTAITDLSATVNQSTSVAAPNSDIQNNVQNSVVPMYDSATHNLVSSVSVSGSVGASTTTSNPSSGMGSAGTGNAGANGVTVTNNVQSDANLDLSTLLN